jgi:hypothetical protein
MKELIMTALSLLAFWLVAEAVDLMSEPKRSMSSDIEPVTFIKQGSN